MLGDHFQIICSPYILTKEVVASRNAYYKVVSHKVSNVGYDRLDRDFMKDEIFVALSSMKNGKSPRVDGVPCELYKLI